MAETIELTSRVSYPQEAASGSKYLVSIDLDHALTPEAWPYDEEEYPVTCFLDAAPSFAQQPAGDPTIIVHRFGGSYGPAQFWLTAGAPGVASIRFVLADGAGVPIATRELDVKIVDRIPLVKQSEPYAVSEVDADTLVTPQRTPRRSPVDAVFRWLHLGDLHASGRSSFAKSPIAKDVENLVADGHHLDAVIVTGDLSMSGRPGELERAGAYLSNLRRIIADTQQDWPPLLVIPGNHDLDWRTPGLLRPVLWEADAALRRRFWLSKIEPARRAVEQGFAAYEKWRIGVESLGGNKRGVLPGDFGVSLEIRGRRVGIVGLNDSFLARPANKRFRADVDRTQLQATCGDLRQWAELHDLRILLTHHHPSFYRTETRARFYEELAPRWLFDVQLYGSTHVKDVTLDRHPDGGDSAPVGCSATYFNSVRQSIQGYHIGEVSLSGGDMTVRVWPRVERAGRMAPDLRSDVGNDGVATVVLGPRPRAPSAPVSSEPPVSTGPVKNRYALLVGLDRYSDPGIPLLLYATEDVRRLAAALDSFGYHVVQLFDEIATLYAILERLERLCFESEPDDLIVFFFAGHIRQAGEGGPDLVSFDVRRDRSKGVRLEDLFEIASRTRRRLLVLGNFPSALPLSVPPGVGLLGGGVGYETAENKIGSHAVALLKALRVASEAPLTVEGLQRALEQDEREVEPAPYIRERTYAYLSSEISNLVFAGPPETDTDTEAKLPPSEPMNSKAERDLSVYYDERGDDELARGNVAAALRSYSAGLEIRRRLVESDPTNRLVQHDLTISYGKVGDSQQAGGDLQAALSSYSEGLKIAAAFVEADPRDVQAQRNLSMYYIRIGALHEAQGDLAAALRSYSECREIREKLAQSDPTNTEWRRDLGVIFGRLGDVQRAEGDLAAARLSYSDCREIAAALIYSDPMNLQWQRDLGISYERLGDSQRAQGDLADALGSYSECRDIREKLAQSNPTNTEWQRELSISYERLGDSRRAQGDLAAARRSYSQCRDIREKLAQSDPTNTLWKRDLGISYERLGDIQRAQGDLVAARRSYSQCRDIREGLAQSDPTNTGWLRDVGISYERLGDIQRTQGHLAAALRSYSDCRNIRERLARFDPTNTLWQRELGFIYVRLGDTQRAQGDLVAALRSCSDYRDIREKLAQSDPTNTEWQRDLGISYERLGDMQQAQGDLADARRSYSQCRDIRKKLARSDPTNTLWQRELGIGYGRLGDNQRAQGDLGAALRSYSDYRDIAAALTQSDPTNSLWQRDLGISYERLGDIQRAQGDLAAALRSYSECGDIREKLAQSDPTNTQWQRDRSISLAKLSGLVEQRGLRTEALRYAEENLAINKRLAALDRNNATWQNDLRTSRALVRRLRSA